MTPSDISRELQIPLGQVSYHVRKLHDYDVLTLERVEERDPSLAHYYRLADAIVDRN